ncbi:pentapeptide repeat-containing protein [Azorhizobium doebereinerae]|uniref:pentapeptide repeat-containing protein n=1 Tax=Azorhizobium doebereinerae TaxID=281091 RepID=UPI00042A1514|nr:pentapeptide repeat-containing protein [Azorhizobium doebereinerae]
MSASEVLQAARKGRAELEAFQRSHPDDTLDFSGVDFRAPENEHITFSDFHFLLPVIFEGATFGDTPVPFQVHGAALGAPGSPKGAALFQNTVFERRAQFSKAKFGSNARFDGAIFKDIVNFVDVTFGEGARFSRAIFQSSSFAHSIFGPMTWFDEILMVRDGSFEESIFGRHVDFSRAIFERVHFQSCLFGEGASFEFTVFSALAQFNNTEFGVGANFEGAAFCGRAGFEGATFGDVASFRGGDRQALVDWADERAKSLLPDYAQVVTERTRAADPSAFHRASFSGATFTTSGTEYATPFTMAEGIKSKTLEALREGLRRVRVLFYPAHDLMRQKFSGADFSNRSLKGSADFSRVRFEQPPDFQNVDPVSSLDFAAARFSFGRRAWLVSRYWTTQTDTVTRLRRLRKIMKDIDEPDLESSLFILQRMAERGIAWRAWWDDVLHGYGIYHLIGARLKSGNREEFSELRRRQLFKIPRSVWVAITGIGRPLMLTLLVFLYRYSSDFSRSILLPLGWFVLFACGFAFLCSSYTATDFRVEQIPDLMAFSLCVSFPVSPLARRSFDEVGSRLFPNGIPEVIFALSIGQAVIETVLLFLVVLAVRNHFRVR